METPLQTMNLKPASAKARIVLRRVSALPHFAQSAHISGMSMTVLKLCDLSWSMCHAVGRSPARLIQL